MGHARVDELVEKLTRSGGLLDYGPELSRLLIRVVRTLARGNPVTREEVGRVAADLGVSGKEVDGLLRQMTERDAEGRIVGIAGLSLADHPHTVLVDGKRLSAWCAEDTLFLPALLGQTAIVESPSPLSRETVRLTVSPERVEAVSPAGAVVSWVIVDPDAADLDSFRAIWSTFCRHIHFFASREEAERWAAGRKDIAVLSVEESFKFGRRMSAKVLRAVQ